MAYDPGAIQATLAAAVGDEPQLIAELHDAFIASAGAAVEALAVANTPEAWCAAARRLKGLAASFGAVRLMALAGEALVAPTREAALVARLRRALQRL